MIRKILSLKCRGRRFTDYFKILVFIDYKLKTNEYNDSTFRKETVVVVRFKNRISRNVFRELSSRKNFNLHFFPDFNYKNRLFHILFRSSSYYNSIWVLVGIQGPATPSLDTHWYSDTHGVLKSLKISSFVP